MSFARCSFRTVLALTIGGTLLVLPTDVVAQEPSRMLEEFK